MKKILPPTYLFICLAILLIGNFILPTRQLIIFPFNLLGLLPIMFGVWLNLSADDLFKDYQTTVKPEEKSDALITEGPFQLSRHPMYLGFVILLLGIAVLLGNLSGFVAPVFMFLLLNFKFIPLEEENMEKDFAQEYQAYKKKVRKWFGKKFF